MSSSILVVEDDAVFAERLKRNLEMAGFKAAVAEDGAAALTKLKGQAFDLVVTDVRMPHVGGLELIRKVKVDGAEGIDPDIPFVVLTSVNSVETAVEAMKAGAADYITKEAERAELVLRLRKVLDQSEMAAENRLLRDQLERKDEFRDLVGESDVMRKIKDEIAQIADKAVTVLVTGQTGVGKELVARAIHRTGPNAKGPFVDVNCAALPDDNLLQSELFGHERGAFTGATEMRKGRFELAHRGTLFLDEIAELGKDSQGKILKALEQQLITRLGGTRSIQVECRLVFATNKDLQEEARQGRFREDLYYRIDVFRIEVPPLRQRRGDIPLLSKFFADQFARKYGKAEFFFEEGAMALLRDYSFPGNIRELRNIVERLVIRTKEDVITRDSVVGVGLGSGAGSAAATRASDRPSVADEDSSVNFSQYVPRPADESSQGAGGVEAGGASPFRLPAEGVDLEKVERELVVQALEKRNWNQKEAAALLNISVDRMNSRVRKYGLRHPSWRVNR